MVDRITIHVILNYNINKKELNMLDKIEKRILDFAKDTGLTDRREMVHGTL